MLVLIPCVGSRGDVQPYMQLALSVQNRHPETKFILGVHKEYVSFVESNGLQTFILNPSIVTILNEASGVDPG